MLFQHIIFSKHLDVATFSSTHFPPFFQASDIVVSKLYDSTEEGQKVTRNNGQKWLAVFQRIEDPAQSS